MTGHRNVIQEWQFTDDQGTFTLPAPHHTSYLYFPLVNSRGMMSAITPTLHGDIKTGQNAYLMPPVSLEDLHNTRSARNFWVSVDGCAPWSAAGNSARQIADDADQVSLEAGLLWHKITRSSDTFGLQAEITSFVPMTNDTVELMRVTITNIHNQPIRLNPTAAIPIYGRSADNLRDHRHVTSLLHRIETHPEGVTVCPTLSFDERGHVPNTVAYGVFGIDQDGTLPAGFTPIVEDFIGEGGSLDWPQAAVDPQSTRPQPAGLTFAGYETIGGLHFEAITLDPQQSHTYILILACMDQDDDPGTLIEAYGSEEKFSSALADCQSFWQTSASAAAFHTADPTFDQWIKWVVIQPTLRRLFGNSFLPAHDYGRGGRGWRDLWQDCLALLLTEPDDVPHLLFSSFAGIRMDGSNATIIGAAPGEFKADRNDIPRVWMDHGVWPYLTTRLYLDQSGDLGFLLRPQTYFKDTHINRCTAHDERWDADQGTQLMTSAGEAYRGTVLEHLLVQHLTAFYHVGEHNIIRLEGADWNDGMDMARSRGESVAFTALYASNLRDLSDLFAALIERGIDTIDIAAELLPLLDTLGDPIDYDDIAAKQRLLAGYFDTCQHTISGKTAAVSLTDLASDLAAKADWLTGHLHQQEWITDRAGYSWFNGYYDDAGQQVEGDHPNGVRMTLTGQVFTLMGGVATDEQARSIVRAARRYLHEPSMGGYRLNTDFGETKLNMGRCFSFAFGHKENGAMFSHMAIMYANALYQRGLVDEGFEVLDDIYRHCCNFETCRIYPGIPEYVNVRGRGMYTWLTGSASWFLLTFVNEVFGVKGELGDLVLEPKLAAGQFDADGAAGIDIAFAGRSLAITYHNAGRLDYGAYRVGAVALDGAVLEADIQTDRARIDRERIAALDVNRAHELHVELVEK
ncbi:MAG: cellobiose phosphorylase [Anaerolineae bacterium]|nr:cellobiose phosphorylase [Anaerolineae bacterium]